MQKAHAKELLQVDAEAAVNKMVEYVRTWAGEERRDGVAMGLSGGVDSALLAAVAVRAMGKDSVHAWFLQDKHSEKDSLEKARAVAGWLGLKLNIGSINETMREKEKEAHFFRLLAKMPKFTLPVLASIYYIVVGESPYITVLRKNEIRRSRLKRWIYDNMMSGVEEMFDGPCAERRVVMERIAKENNWLLIGSGNRSEDMTGWFTIDGIDNMPCSPIVFLYKTQVKQVASHMGVPDLILKRKPSADVLKGADDALTLGMSFEKIDIVLYGIDHGMSDAELMKCGVSIPEITRVRRIHHLSEWRRAQGKRYSTK
jgi:NAD+ synthase